MKAEYYAKKKKEYNDIQTKLWNEYQDNLKKLNDGMNSLKFDFVKANCKHKHGDPVQVDTEEGVVTAFFRTAEFKVKPDGTPFVEYYVVNRKNRQVKGEVL